MRICLNHLLVSQIQLNLIALARDDATLTESWVLLASLCAIKKQS